jgi:hypothetical protein
MWSSRHDHCHSLSSSGGHNFPPRRFPECDAAPDCSCRAVAKLLRRAFRLSEVNTGGGVRYEKDEDASVTTAKNPRADTASFVIHRHIVTSKLKVSSVCTHAHSLGRQRRPKLTESPRTLIYPHDTSELGPLRRTLALAKAFVEVVTRTVDLTSQIMARSTEKGKPIARWGRKAKGLRGGSRLQVEGAH